MSAGIYNFTIEQGTTWVKTLYFAQSDVGNIFANTSPTTITVDATAKTYTRNDDEGSWIVDGLQEGDYIIISGFSKQENNGSHIITTLTDQVITCSGSTLKDEIGSPITTGNQIVILKAMDLTDYTGAAMIRKKYSSETATATITVTFDVSTPKDGIVTLSLTANQTAAIPAGETTETLASQYVWDLEFTKDSVVTRMLQGTVSISPEVTR